MIIQCGHHTALAADVMLSSHTNKSYHSARIKIPSLYLKLVPPIRSAFVALCYVDGASKGMKWDSIQRRP